MKEIVEAILAAETAAEQTEAAATQRAFEIGIAAHKRAEEYAEGVQTATRDAVKAVLAQAARDGESQAAARVAAAAAVAATKTAADGAAYDDAVRFALKKFEASI
ncbi:MAG: hypothetical protein LBM78_02895 [Clostridiales bacterium]|nr:hypothetical protein [Clostridiales bacterium]